MRMTVLTLVVVSLAAGSLLQTGCGRESGEKANPSGTDAISRTTTEEAPAGEKRKEAGPEQIRKETPPMVIMETSHGAIKIELFADKAPETAKNFLRYADEEFYDGTIFHRVIDDFMIQGGGFMRNMRQKKTHAPIRNEARADVQNLAGTIAMARTNDIHSATAQFFINLKHNAFLDHRDDTPDGFGYAAFGRVTEGMDVVKKIGKLKTGSVGRMDNVPVAPIIIHSIRRLAPQTGQQ